MDSGALLALRRHKPRKTFRPCGEKRKKVELYTIAVQRACSSAQGAMRTSVDMPASRTRVEQQRQPSSQKTHVRARMVQV